MTVEATTPAAPASPAPVVDVAAGTPAAVTGEPAPAQAVATEGAAPASSAAAPSSEAAKPAAEEGLPEIKLPEGVEVDEKMLGEFKTLAKDIGLDSPKASKAALWYTQQLAAAEKSVMDAMVARDAGWVKEIKADPALGEKGMADAQKALLRFGGPETADAIAKLGLSNYPPMVRMLAKIGQGMAEDTTSAQGASTGAKPKPLSMDEKFSRMYQTRTAGR